MKQVVFAAAAALFALQYAPAMAADAAKKPTAQQEKMTACNKEAGEKKLKGDERKQFMSTCLSNKPAGASAGKAADSKPAAAAASQPATAKSSQQEKMTACNKEAGEKKLKGDERKKFMSDCLKG